MGPDSHLQYRDVLIVDIVYTSGIGFHPLPQLHLTKIDADRVNYTLINPIDPLVDKNIMYTLQNAPEKVGGFFFCGNKESLIVYRELYHRVHELLQHQSIVDDDQHLALLCYLERPDLFCMHHLGGFHKALTTFQKESVPEK